MADDRLTFLDLLVMMAINGLARDGDRSYGVTIVNRIKRDTGRDVALQSVYDCLKSLQTRKCIKTSIGDPSPTRGGRSTVLCQLLDHGRATLLNQLREIEDMSGNIDGADEGAAGRAEHAY